MSGSNSPDLQTRLAEAIGSWRTLAKEYNLLTDEKQKAVRAQLHKKHGDFSKVLCPTLGMFAKIEEKESVAGK
jgi:hypothetical protein